MGTAGVGLHEKRREYFSLSKKVYLRGPLVNIVHPFESITYLSSLLNLQFEFSFEVKEREREPDACANET